MRIDTEIRSRDETFEEKTKHNNPLDRCGSSGRLQTVSSMQVNGFELAW